MSEHALEMPRDLLASPERWDTDERRQWIADLPDLVRGYAARWSLELGAPYQPGGQSAWVAPVRRRLPGGGLGPADLVLKVGWWHYEAEFEAEGLRLWDGDGAVRLHQNERADRTVALLLERCYPGSPLGQSLPGPEQDVVVAGLLRRLWAEPPDDVPLRPLEQMCDAWADGTAEKLAASPGLVDPGLAQDGLSLFRELPRTATGRSVIVTDLHAANVLAARREPWLVIDPKPWVGDPHYDPLQHMLNEQQRLLDDPVGLVHRMADLLDLDRDRLRAWMFARCVQESADVPGLLPAARALAH